MCAKISISMYQHGKRTTRPKDKKVFLKTAFVLGIALIVVAIILRRDLSTSTKEKTTVPIVTEVGEVKGDVIKINEPLFVMELPADWSQTDRKNESYANYYEWHSSKKGGNDRRLLLHIDIMPTSYKITRLLPLIVSVNKFNQGNISGHCVNFATAAVNNGSNAPVEAKWEGVTFVCDPIEANQTVGTGLAADGIGAKLGTHRFFFYYEDHNIRPDDKILQDAVRSFQAK